MKKNSSKKKAALMLAVMGLGSYTSMASDGFMNGLFAGVSIAEAGVDHWVVIDGDTRGIPAEGYNIISDGTDIYLVGREYSQQAMSWVDVRRKYNGGISTTNLADVENRSKSDATIKANAAESNAKAYADAIAAGKANTGLDNITEAGKGIIRELAKAEMKNTGVNTEGTTVVIEKTTEIKGGLNVDGPIHGKGDMEVDGKTTLHGDTVIEGNTIIKGKTINQGEVVNETTVTNKGNVINEADVTTKGTTTHEGKTINKGEVVNETTVTNKGDVINEANVTTKGTTTHEGEVINKSLVTNESDVHTKGNEIIDGNATIHGNTTIDGTTTLKGDTTIGDSAEDKVIINGTAEFKENTRFDKDVTVKGSQTIEQNLRVRGDSVTEGNSVVKGNSTVEGDATIKGSTTLGDDKNTDVLEVNAKTNIHGDTTIGDSSDDKFTVNATSEFKSDATFDQNVLVKGDQTVEGNSHTKGNAEVDKDLAVHGSEVIDGDSHVKGNMTVDKDMTVHGVMVVDGGMQVSDDFGTKGNMTVDKTLTVGGDAHISGDTILDGKFFAKGAATFGDSVDITKNLTVGGNAHVIGDSVVDGDSYARSFNIGNEKYIDKDGINANNHKIRNVADGDIGPDSLDAVNGRQLWHTREALQNNISQVGAQAAALSNLHPMDFEYGDKVSVAAAVGGYQNKQAFALGAFFKPTQKSMISLTGTLGMSQNMYGIGYTQKFGKKSDFEHMTETQLKDELMKLDKDAAEIREHDKQMREENSKLKAEVFDLKSEIAKTNKQATAQENKIAALTAKNADMEKAYNKLMSKVDGMATELATLKAASQK